MLTNPIISRVIPSVKTLESRFNQTDPLFFLKIAPVNKGSFILYYKY